MDYYYVFQGWDRYNLIVSGIKILKSEYPNLPKGVRMYTRDNPSLGIQHIGTKVLTLKCGGVLCN